MQTAILLWVTLRTDWNKEVGIPKVCRIKDKIFIFAFVFSSINHNYCSNHEC